MHFVRVCLFFDRDDEEGQKLPQSALTERVMKNARKKNANEN
jgi:hypothetical protein